MSYSSVLHKCTDYSMKNWILIQDKRTYCLCIKIQEYEIPVKNVWIKIQESGKNRDNIVVTQTIQTNMPGRWTGIDYRTLSRESHGKCGTAFEKSTVPRLQGPPTFLSGLADCFIFQKIGRKKQKEELSLLDLIVIKREELLNDKNQHGFIIYQPYRSTLFHFCLLFMD